MDKSCTLADLRLVRARHLGIGELGLPGQWLDDVRNHVVQGPTSDKGLESVVEAPELPTLNGTAWTPRALLLQAAAKRNDRSKPCVAKMLITPPWARNAQTNASTFTIRAGLQEFYSNSGPEESAPPAADPACAESASAARA